MDDKAKKALTDEYEAFLRVGRLTPDDWFPLDKEEQAALLRAQKRLDIERAVMLATAVQGPEAVASMVSEVDGGKAKVRAVVDRAVNRWIAKRQAKDSA